MSQPTLPICVKCNLEMRPDTNGVTVLLMAYNAFWMHFHEGTQPDIAKENVFQVYENVKSLPATEEQHNG